jgi:hypothetical protein
MQNITIIYERNACQVRLRYTWLREIIRSITITLLKYPTWGGILPENNTDVDNDHE